MADQLNTDEDLVALYGANGTLVTSYKYNSLCVSLASLIGAPALHSEAQLHGIPV